MAISPSVTDISALAAAAYVVGFEDISGHTKQFATKASGSYAVINGTDLPQVASVTAVQATDPVSGSAKTGSYKITLTPSSDDVVNVSSPMFYTVDTGCQVLTNATAN